MELTKSEQWQELLSSVDNFIFDCDGKIVLNKLKAPLKSHVLCFVSLALGVLWSAGEPIPGAQDVIKFLRENVRGRSSSYVCLPHRSYHGKVYTW